jgi:ankyrin repeat protein
MAGQGQQLSVTGTDVGTPEAQLLIATQRGDLSAMRALLGRAAGGAAGAAAGEKPPPDVNRCVQTEQHGPMTSLMEAARSHDVRVLELLLGAGARPEVEGAASDAATAFHFACGRGTEAHVRCLIDAGCDMEARDAEGRTGLMVAAIEGRPDVLEILVDAGAALDTSNDSGWTAFHCACSKGQRWHADCVAVLVAAGCDQQARTIDNLSGQMMAEVCPHPFIPWSTHLRSSRELVRCAAADGTGAAPRSVVFIGPSADGGAGAAPAAREREAGVSAGTAAAAAHAGHGWRRRWWRGRRGRGREASALELQLPPHLPG